MFVNRPSKQSPTPAAAGWDDLRGHNTALLFRAIWCEDGISRADLARLTGLSRATVSDIVGELITSGAVSESEVAPSSGGRPPIRLRFEDGWRHLVGVELGASHVSAVRTDLRGRPLAETRVDRDVAGDPEGTVATIVDAVRGLLAAAPDVPVLGVGLGVPSPVLQGAGGQLSPRLFPSWRGVDLLDRLGAAFHLPIRVDNDANLGALAEHWWGGARDVRHLAYIKIATGVGAGILIDGVVYRGATGIAGEIGHTTIDTHGPRCRCGLNGCLEAMVGSGPLLQRAEARLASLPDRPAWAHGPLGIRALLDGAVAGEPLAVELVTEAGAALGIAVANLLNLVNPARVILGGPLTEAGPLLFDPMRAAIAQRALWSSVEGSTLLISPLGDRAVPLGAATMLLQEMLDDPRPVLDGAEPLPLVSPDAVPLTL